jgi:tetratricopeptide (TPR) repeat protein
VETSVQSGFKSLEVLAQVRLGQALTSLGQLRDARSLLDEAVDTSKKLGLHPLLATAAAAMSHLYFVSGDFESAVRTSADAVGIAKPMALKPILFRGCVALGDALFNLGRSQKAGDAYREAHRVHQSLVAGMEPIHAQVYRANPEIRQALGRISGRLMS